MSALTQHVQIECDLGGVKIVLVDEHTPPEDRDAVLDSFVRSCDRQMMKVELAKTINEYSAKRVELAGLPDARAAYQKKRAGEREKLMAGFIVAHNAASKRGDWKANRAETAALEKFDQDTKAQLVAYDGDAVRLPKILEVLDAQIERQRRIINGEDNADVHEASAKAIPVPEPLPIAAE